MKWDPNAAMTAAQIAKSKKALPVVRRVIQKSQPAPKAATNTPTQSSGLMGNDIAAQAQAAYFQQAFNQANSPIPGKMSPAPVRQVGQQMPIQSPPLAQIPPPATTAPGGLLGGTAPAPATPGGLMDFNALAMQLAGNPGPQQADRAAMIRQIFGTGLPGMMPTDVGSGRDRDKEKKLFMLSPATGIANWTNQQLGIRGLFD